MSSVDRAVPEGDRDRVGERLGGELGTEGLDLAADSLAADVAQSGYVAGVQAVRDVAEYFQLDRGQRGQVAARVETISEDAVRGW